MTRKKRKSWTFDGTDEPAPGQDFQINTRKLTADDMNVVFQPIVDLATGKQFGVEALARCKRGALRDPVLLFKQAVLDKACGYLGRVIRDVAFSRCERIPLFVNLHPSELSSRWLVRPDDPLNFHDGQVFLEVTETAAFEYFDLCKGTMAEVSARSGARLVIDDFGAGYSNLKRVIDLEPAIVKLDRELISGIDASHRQQELVRYVVQLCDGLGAHVVAEGIETVDELKAVRDTGARYGQGYLLARPNYPVPEIEWPLTANGRRRPSYRPKGSRSSDRPKAQRRSSRPPHRPSKPPARPSDSDLPVAKKRSEPPRRPSTKRPSARRK